MIKIAIRVKKKYLGRDTREANLVNENIRFPKVMVIAKDGQKIGVMPTAEAQKLADKAELDLVCISPKAEIPVVKIIDYGKFLFDKKKQDKENKRGQIVVETKEIRLSSQIGPGDFDTRVKHARKFLEEGQRLKVSLKFRYRELQAPETKQVGLDVMDRFIESIADLSAVDKKPVFNKIFYDAYLRSTVKNPRKPSAQNGLQADKEKAEKSNTEVKKSTTETKVNKETQGEKENGK